MMIVTKKKVSKLSCDMLAILSETDDSFEIVAYNFRDKVWQPNSRLMKKETLLKNYKLKEDC